MSSDPLRRVVPGQAVSRSAELWNALIDSARATRERELSRPGGPIESGLDQQVIRVRNNSGSPVGRSAVLAVSDPIILPEDSLEQFQRATAFEGDTPTSSTPAGQWCVTLEPISNGAIGRAVIAGIARVKVDATAATEDFAEFKADTTDCLVCDAEGTARILWLETTGEICWAVVRLGDGAQGEGGGSLTVKEIDGSPEYTGTMTIEVDQADGLSITQPAAGRVRLDLLAASTSQRGIVGTSADGLQEFTGIKRFGDGIQIRDQVEFVGAGSYPYSRILHGPFSSGPDVGSLWRLILEDGTVSSAFLNDLRFYNDGTNTRLYIGGTAPAFQINDGVTTHTGQTGTYGGLEFVGGMLKGGSFSGGIGTVTSVGLSMPSIFTVSPSSITTSGTFGVSLAAQTANTVFAGPTTGSPAAPTFRALTVADLPAGFAVTDGDKGDITVSGSGATWTIDPGVVTYAKMQDVSATSRILCRRSPGVGPPEEGTLTQVLDMVGSAAQGDVLYRGASAWDRLPAGTAGYVLTTGGTGANPSWTAATTPSGTVAMFAGSSAPTGWLVCDGSAVSRTTYANLFSAIGTTWGSGDGSTTFNVPDMRGRAPIGVGTGSGLTSRTLAGSGGTETHTLTEGEMPTHTHGPTSGAAEIWMRNFGGGLDVNLSLGSGGQDGAKSVTGTTGGGGAHNNMQPWRAINFIIKT